METKPETLEAENAAMRKAIRGLLDGCDSVAGVLMSGARGGEEINEERMESLAARLRRDMVNAVLPAALSPGAPAAKEPAWVAWPTEPGAYYVRDKDNEWLEAVAEFERNADGVLGYWSTGSNNFCTTASAVLVFQRIPSPREDAR